MTDMLLMPPSPPPPPPAPVSPLRRVMAGALCASGAAWLSRRRLATGGPYMRAVNYHQTLATNAATFESHLRFYAKHFAPVTEADLTRMLDGGEWRHDKPGILVSFDDGAISNYTVAAPLLEKHGLVGWFFVPAALGDCPPSEQRAFADAHNLPAWPLEPAPPGGRLGMSWDDMRDLIRRGHVVGCHTMTHRELGPTVPAADLRVEVVDSRKLMEDRLGVAVTSFCWVGGGETAYSATAARAIADAGYRLGFMTNSHPLRRGTHPLQLDRTNVEDRYPLCVAAISASGLLDARYRAKRERVHAMTSVR